VATFITIEAPISGMSMNPARTFASATGTRVFDSLWIYFLAPPLGMLAAVEARARLGSLAGIHCAKLHHANSQRCIFRCGYGNPEPQSFPAAAEGRG
jgi:aquaporin Z